MTTISALIFLYRGRGSGLIFEKIPTKKFENFHNIFSGSNEKSFNICRECGGACEHNKIGTLMPGEKEYMAGKMGLSVSEFEARYLDILEMGDGTRIDVLKLGKLCPFLNRETDRCECREFKVILCKIYPVVFTVEEGEVNFIIDDWCQLSGKKECRSYFETAMPLLSDFSIPVEWFRYVASYDNLCFDYTLLQEQRKGKNRCEVFSLEKLLNLQKSGSGTDLLHTNQDSEIGETTF